MVISTPTLSHKIDRTFIAPTKKLAPFGPSDVHLEDIEKLPDTEKSQYSPSVAYLMAVISAWSYSDEAVLGAKLRYCGMPGAHVRQISVVNNALLVVSTAYLILSRTGRVGVLAFRGTDPANGITILADAEVTQRPFGVGAVHAGFYANVEAVWDEVIEAIDGARRGVFVKKDGESAGLPEKLNTLYITGHSLGGAMAVLCAARLFGTGYDDWMIKDLLKGVYTFGQPMVGDKRFADGGFEQFGDRHFRHVYRHDLVPHLPPTPGLQYAHAGQERRTSTITKGWDDGKPPSERATPAALPQLALDFVGRRLFPALPVGVYSLDDHMPRNYVDACRSAIVENTVIAPNGSKTNGFGRGLPHLANAAQGIVQRAQSRVSALVSLVRGN